MSFITHYLNDNITLCWSTFMQKYGSSMSHAYCRSVAYP